MYIIKKGTETIKEIVISLCTPLGDLSHVYRGTYESRRGGIYKEGDEAYITEGKGSLIGKENGTY